MPGRMRPRGQVGPRAAGRAAGNGPRANQPGNRSLLDVIFGRDAAPISEVATRNADSSLLEDDAPTQAVAVTPDVEAPAAAPAAQGPAGPAASDVPGLTGEVYEEHVANVADLRDTLTSSQRDELASFKANYEANKGRYQTVASQAGVPVALVAAIHWRESSGDFSTYLHQGDPLGKKAVHVPKDIPLFTVWEEAAVHALTMSDKQKVHDDLGMTEDTRDAASMATYAEFYNGLGYHNGGHESPYVYSGTDEYSGGKYVRDGVFSASTKDKQLGVMAMVGAVGGMNEQIKPIDWSVVLHGKTTLKRGSEGALVEELQRRLAAKGFPAGDDGDFGPTVENAVKKFQKSVHIEADGQVGSGTASLL